MRKSRVAARWCVVVLGIAFWPAGLAFGSEDIALRIAEDRVEKYAKLEAAIKNREPLKE